MSSSVPFLKEEPTFVHQTPTIPTYRVRQTAPVSSGPFYFYSPGETVAVHDDQLGFPYFPVGLIQPLEDQKFWVPAVYLDQSEEERSRVNPLTGKDEDEERAYKVPASANRLSTILKYGPGVKGNPPGESNHGLIEIESFAMREPRNIGVQPFNRKICPAMIDYKRVPEDLQKRVAQVGGLEVRKEFVLAGREFFLSDSFLSQANLELQTLYLRAIEEILEGIEIYRYFASSYLDRSDKAVQQGEKTGYDERDYRLMWLLNRQGVDSALTRALSESKGGLTAEQLQAVLQSVTGQNQGAAITPDLIAQIAAQAAAAVVAQFQQKPDPKEAAELQQIIDGPDGEEFDKVTGGKKRK